MIQMFLSKIFWNCKHIFYSQVSPTTVAPQEAQERFIYFTKIKIGQINKKYTKNITENTRRVFLLVKKINSLIKSPLNLMKL